MSTHRMPAAEVRVRPELVRALLADQHPDLAGLGVEVLASGWDNVVYRLGEAYVVRLPRRTAAAALVVNELRLLPALAQDLPLPVPAPVRAGRPGRGYPWAWSVAPYLPGEIAARTPPRDPARAALALGAFLAALHRPAPADAPANPARGIPLAGREEGVLGALEVHGILDGAAHLDGAPPQVPAVRAALLRVWESAVTAPRWQGPPLWLHGDLHPANILVDRGETAAVIDFGDLTSGDPATDLAVAWMLLPARERALLRQAYGRADDAMWARARGWALALSLVFLTHSADNPLMAGVGRRTLDAVLRDAPKPR